MPDDERRRRAVEAVHTHDAGTLCELTRAGLLLYGRRGAKLAAHTWERYRAAILELVADWHEENIIRPRRNAGALWVRELEARGLATPSVRIRLAAGRAMYAALGWAGATDAHPWREVSAASDNTAAWDRRQAYQEYEVRRLIDVSAGGDRFLVLLCAHAGLRVSEAIALDWSDVELASRVIILRSGKGGRGVS